jgi:hypothetical protein
VSRGQVVGTITGIVSDSSGAVIPNAKVTITNTGTGVEARTLETNASGIYTAEGLPVGSYMVAVEASGFQRSVQSNITLNVADRLGINFSLKVGAVTQTIEVTGAPPLVSTQTGEQSASVSIAQIQDLPILGRNINQMQQVIPGTSRTAGAEIGQGAYAAKGFAVNGFNQDYSAELLDGVFNSDMGSNTNAEVSPGPDTLAEFKVLTSNYSAKYGQSSGAILLSVTRSGTKDFHGAAYEYVRNDKLDAADFFLNSNNETKSPLRYNDFGYDIGGPFYIPGHYNTDKSKTFFFWSNEWRKDIYASPVLAATPTQAMRTGDFTGYGPLTNPTTAAGQPLTDSNGTPCVGGTAMTQINPNCINNNVSLLFQQDFPKPNNPGFYNFLEPAKANQIWSEELIRVDQNINEKLRTFVRYIHDGWSEADPTVLWSGDSFPTIHSVYIYPSRSLIAKLTAVITPKVLNEFSYQYESSYGSPHPPSVDILGADTKPAGYNVQQVYNTSNTIIPDMSFSGGWGGISSLWGAWWAHHNISEWVDDLSIQAGRHSLSMGGLYEWSQTPVQSQSSPSLQGSYSFDGHNTGNPIADAVLGLPASYGELEGYRQPMYDYHQFEGYFQDDFKVSKRLTLNLGVRYFYIPHVYSDTITAFLPSAYNLSNAPTVTPGGTIVANTGNLLDGIVFPGKNGVPRGFVENHKDTIAPRFGFAFDPKGDGKTAIRGGYGAGYYRIAGNDVYTLVGNPPLSKEATFLNPPFNNPAAGVAAPLTPLALNTVDQVYDVPKSQTWSLGVQRQVTQDFMVNVAYVGSSGDHLDYDLNINQPPPAMGYDFDPRIGCTQTTPYPCTSRISSAYVSPYLGWSSITSAVPVGYSIYHSLQVTVEKRVSHGLSFGAAYTWSKAIALSSGGGLGSQPQNPYDLKADRGLASFDRPQVLVLNYIYQIPAFRNSKGFTRALLGGWQTSGVLTFQSGSALQAYYTSPTQGLATYPNAVAGVSTNGPKTVNEWFNTQAFTAPPFGYYGNAGVDTIRGPGTNNWDMSGFKTFRFTESVKLAFRADFFNAWNHTNFIGVQTTYGAGGFGQLTSDYQPRVVQLSLKLEF